MKKNQYVIIEKIKQNDCFLLLAWVIFSCIYFYAMFILAPGRGGDWSSDDGYVLANAWNLSNKAALDKTLPQQTLYIVYATLMKLGISKYLHFRYFFITFTALSSLLFFSTLDKRGLKSSVVPIAAGAPLLVTFTSVGTFYQFFLLGCGMYFLSQKRELEGEESGLTLMLSGIFLGIQAFLNASIGVGMIVLVLFMLAINKKLIKTMFIPSFFITIIVIWGVYALKLGVDNLLIVPGGHVFDIQYFFNRILIILKSFIKLFILYIFTVLLFYKFNDKKYLYSLNTLIIFITIFTLYCFIITLVSPELMISLKYIGIDVLRFIPDVIDKFFSSPAASKMQVPAMAFNLLVIVILSWIMIVKGDDGYSHIINDGILKNILIAAIGFLLLFCSYATPSNVNLTTLQSAFSGPMLGLAIILISNINYKTPIIKSLILPCVSIYFLILAILGLYYNIPISRQLIDKNNMQIVGGALDGIYESPKFLSSMKTLENAYFSNECDQKLFSALDYVPLIYYIMKNGYFITSPVVRTAFFFSPQIEFDIRNSHKWCVLDVTTSESRDYIDRIGNDNVRNKIRDYLKENKTNFIKIPSPSTDIQDMILYIKR